jgi:hypothetical protein
VRDDFDHIRLTFIVLLRDPARYRVLRNPIMKALDERASESVPPVFFQYGEAAEFVVRPLCRSSGG